MATWQIEEISERHSQAAGDLVKRILADEFGTAATVCADGDLEDMHAAYAGPNRNCWIAVDSCAVAAVLAAQVIPAGALELKRLYVAEPLRGAGVARALLDTLHRWAAERDYQQIVLTTTNFMARARRFYEQAGYKQFAEVPVDGIVLHRYRRTGPAGTVGARIVADDPQVCGEGEFGVVVERPRGRVEGWHYQRGTSELILAEHYPIPVPVNYGYIPDWMNPADGEPLDAIVLDDRRMRPGEALVCEGVGVLHRPDGDDKLLVLPKGGAESAVNLNEAFRDRVSAWWGSDEQPTGWSGRDGISELLDLCIRTEVTT